MSSTILNEDEKELPWDQTGYQDFLAKTSADIRFEEIKNHVVDALGILDCEKSEAENPLYTPCGSSAGVSAVTKKLQREFGKLCKISLADHNVAALNELKRVVCNGSANALFVLRGLLDSPTLVGEAFEKPSAASADFVSYVSGRKCPVSTSLLETDRSRLEFIKNSAKAAP